MIDATGMPQTAVVIGGSSQIARDTLCLLAERRLRAVVLAGRDEAAPSERPPWSWAAAGSSALPLIIST